MAVRTDMISTTKNVHMDGPLTAFKTCRVHACAVQYGVQLDSHCIADQCSWRCRLASDLKRRLGMTVPLLVHLLVRRHGGGTRPWCRILSWPLGGTARGIGGCQYKYSSAKTTSTVTHHNYASWNASESPICPLRPTSVASTAVSTHRLRPPVPPGPNTPTIPWLPAPAPPACLSRATYCWSVSRAQPGWSSNERTAVSALRRTILPASGCVPSFTVHSRPWSGSAMGSRRLFPGSPSASESCRSCVTPGSHAPGTW
jgi:hypothetical protein